MKEKLQASTVRKIFGAGMAASEKNKSEKSRWACEWIDDDSKDVKYPHKIPRYAGEVLFSCDEYVEIDCLSCITGDLTGEVKKIASSNVKVYRNEEGLQKALSEFWKYYYQWRDLNAEKYKIK